MVLIENAVSPSYNFLMNVAYHSSDGFVPVLATSMTSLLVNSKHPELVNFYVLEESITSTNKEKLEKLAQCYGARVVFISMPDINKTYELGLKPVKKIWFFNSYCRLFLYDILPNDVERVLYLDSDTLILQDLSDFYNSDLGDKCLMAMPDCLSQAYYDVLGVSKEFSYCNSGVILQDLRKIRQIDFLAKIKQFISEKGGYVFFMEQTVLSGALGEFVSWGELRYNTQTIHILFTYAQYLAYKKPINPISHKEYDEARSNPAIAHLTNFFAVRNRAWFKKTNHPLRVTFERYYSMTPWGKEAFAFQDKRSFGTKLFDAVLVLLPNSFKAWFFGLVYNGPRVKRIKKVLAKCRKEE